MKITTIASTFWTHTLSIIGSTTFGGSRYKFQHNTRAIRMKLENIKINYIKRRA